MDYPRREASPKNDEVRRTSFNGLIGNLLVFVGLSFGFGYSLTLFLNDAGGAKAAATLFLGFVFAGFGIRLTRK